MTSSDMLSINNVAAKLGLSVHQLRRWELMFGLEIKRGRGQQRQYREEDMSVLERIKELVEQGWPTSQIRPQLEAEGLLTPKLIGAPPAPGNPEVLQEAIIGLRNFSERRFIDLSKQIDELRQLLISVTLKQELSTDRTSPWQPMASEYVPAPKTMPAQEITIGPQISIDPPKSQPMPPMGARVNQIPPSASASPAVGSPTGQSTSSSSYPAVSSGATGGQSGSSYSAAPAPGSSEFSQRSMIGTGSSAENKPAIPDIDEAPKPITDALQRSMSTLDSLFKDSRNTPGLGSGQTDSTASAAQTSSTTSSQSLPAAGPGGQPVRYSTIPPTPSPAPNLSPSSTPSSTSSSSLPATSSSAPSSTPGAPSQTTSTTSASNTPAANPSGQSAWGSNPNNPALPAQPAGAAPGSQFGGPKAVTPGYPDNSQAAPSPSETPAQPAGTAPATSSSGAPATAWDQAFTATSVDIDAAPSGLFEGPAAAGPAPGSERNPFTTITGSSISSVDIKPVDSSGPALMGQSGGQSGVQSGVQSGLQGFASNPLNQTGPMPAHTSVESFAPEQKDKLITSQSDSTSTDLPRSQEPALQPPPPPEPAVVPPLPMTAGPQVNFGPSVSAPTPQVTPQRMDDNFGLGEVTDQNYLTVLGRALDLIGWSDEQADSFSLKTFGVPHWDELGRSQAEKLVAHLVGLLKDQISQ